MSATVYYASTSELATLTNTFKVNGTATDPSTVTVTVTTPSGTATSYTYAGSQVTKTSTGLYTIDVACTEAGTWQYVWTGTGTAADVVAGTWTVFGTQLQRLYCSVEELKSRLSIGDTVDDLEIRLAIEAASRGIDKHCNRRQFWRGTDTRTYVPKDWYSTPIDDLVSVTSLATDEDWDGTYETVWSAGTDYQLLPLNASSGAEPEPYNEIKALARVFPAYRGLRYRDDRVQVTGVFGWPEIPAAVKQACLALSADVFGLKDARFGVQSYGDFAMRIRSNGQVCDMLAPYRRSPVLVA